MDWYYILLIVLGSILVIFSIVFLILFLISKNQKNKKNKEDNQFVYTLLELFGGLNNIDKSECNGSRLTLYLKDNSFINENTLKILTDKGMGVFKTSKKITLVVGALALTYNKVINSMLENN